MFGKPDWFREKRIGWGLVPVNWRGWVYTTGWVAALGGPFLLLVERQQALEALIWLGGALGLLIWDVRAILQAKRPDAKEVLYIGDEEGHPQRAVTNRFQFQWRK
jgi:hypothetical protein